MQNNFKFFGSQPHTTKTADRNVLGLPQNKNVILNTDKNMNAAPNANQVSSFFNAGPNPQAQGNTSFMKMLAQQGENPTRNKFNT